jgi:hypothetical protein
MTLSLMLAASARGATYYVASSGASDNNTGLAGSPWATLQKAANSVAAGDSVIVGSGTYAGFDLRTSGTASQRITFSAQAGAVINQRNAVTADGINIENASYVTVEGFTLNGNGILGTAAPTMGFATVGRLAETGFKFGRWLDLVFMQIVLDEQSR